MYDLIICVYACATKEFYKQQIHKINETYGSLVNLYNMKLVYFLGEEVTDLVGDIYVHLEGVHNDYMSASYKQYLGLKYIYEKYSTKFVMCIGTDTYLNIKKLSKYLQSIDYTRNQYIGGHGCVRKIGEKDIYFHSGGPGFILTKGCFDKIYPRVGTFMDEWLRICREYNLKNLEPACDVGIAYLVQLPEINSEIIKSTEFEFTHCNYLGIPCHIRRVDYTKLISCHLMSLMDFDIFTQFLERNNYFE